MTATPGGLGPSDPAKAQTLNTKCLAGLACPGCGAPGPFRIAASCWATVTDAGVGNVEELAWDDDSPCRCHDCGHTGIVLGFRQPTASDLGAAYFAAVTRPIELTGADAAAVRALLDPGDPADPGDPCR